MRYDWGGAFTPQIMELGKTIFILGTSAMGPVNQPIKVTSPDQAFNTFGSEENGTLIKNYLQAYQTAPNLDYHLLRITGTHAKANLLGDNNNIVLSFKARSAGETGNQISIEIKSIFNQDGWPSQALIINHSDGLNKSIFSLNQYQTIGLLTAAINNTFCPVYASTKYGNLEPQSIINSNNNIIYLTNGSDGLNASKNDLYQALKNTLNLIEGLTIDVILITGMYFDDVYEQSFYNIDKYGKAFYTDNKDILNLIDDNKIATYHELLIDFCRAQHRFGIMTHGVIGVRPMDNPELIKQIPEYIKWFINITLLSNRYGFNHYSGPENIDKGYYISIVAGDFLFNENTEYAYWDNGAAVYAAMWLNSEFITTTNMEIPNITKQRISFDLSDLKLLSNNGIVCFRYSPLKKKYVVVSGVTPAIKESDLHLDINVKMVQFTINYLNNIIKSVIGENANKPILQKQLEELINERLGALQDINFLREYDFKVIPLSYDHWRLELSVRAKNMIDKINIPINFTFGGELNGPL